MTTPWIALALQTLAMLGALAGVYARISSRLTAIETRLALDDRQREASDEARETAAELMLLRHCQQTQRACPAYQEQARWPESSAVTDPGSRTP